VTGSLAIAAITPHGDLAIADACDDATRGLATATQDAMDTVARRIASSGADGVVVVTPHGVHVSRHMAVVTGSAAVGTLDDAPVPLTISCALDTPLARAIAGEMAIGGIPVVEVSYGGNNPAEAVMPLDWGAGVPLWHVLRHAPSLPAVLVAPARDLGADQHVAAGAAIASAAAAAGRTIAFIASADQGHGHRADGRYGFRAESAPFDERITDIVRNGRLDELEEITADEVHAALADSWWQMLMLLGALRQNGVPYHSELLAYEAPTYYGMLTALLTPHPRAA
jgi:aromatic ring-opening dioxygenase LigB subunit